MRVGFSDEESETEQAVQEQLRREERREGVRREVEEGVGEELEEMPTRAQPRRQMSVESRDYSSDGSVYQEGSPSSARGVDAAGVLADMHRARETARVQRQRAARAREERARQRLQQGGHRQQRLAWTQEEEEQLVRLYLRYPGRFSAMLRYDEGHGNVLGCRSQVGCKDKIRNLVAAQIRYVDGSRIRLILTKVVLEYSLRGFFER